jgi:hypothetical protein
MIFFPFFVARLLTLFSRPSYYAHTIETPIRLFDGFLVTFDNVQITTNPQLSVHQGRVAPAGIVAGIGNDKRKYSRGNSLPRWLLDRSLPI